MFLDRELGPALSALTPAGEMKGNGASPGDSSPRMHGLGALSQRFLLSMVLLDLREACARLGRGSTVRSRACPGGCESGRARAGGEAN